MIIELQKKFVEFFDKMVCGEGIKVKNNKIISILCYLSIFVTLIAGYQVALEYYQSYNFFQNEGIAMRALKVAPLFAGVILICIYFIPVIIQSVTTLYWYLFIFLTMMPLLIVYVLNGIADSKNVIVFIYTIFFLILLGLLLLQKVEIKLPVIKISERTFLGLIISFTVIGYGYLFIKLGLPKNFIEAFTDVYAVRLGYRASGGLVDYFVQWLGNITTPFLLAYTLKEKKLYKFAIIPIALEILLYGYTAYKSLFVVLVLAPFFGFVLKKGIRRDFMEKGILLMIVVGVVMGCLGKPAIYLKLVLRIFLWPCLIALEYFDFFWMYPKMFLSHSIFKGFMKNIYQMEPSFYMATVYCGKPNMRLNTTWYADAYMNLGYGGLFLFAIGLYIILLIMKNIEKKNIYLVSALLFGGIMELFNAPLLTTILTHGLGVGLLFAYLMPTKQMRKE